MPPTALGEVPFPASVVNTAAGSQHAGERVAGGDRRTLRVARKRVSDCSRSGDGPNQAAPIGTFREGAFPEIPQPCQASGQSPARDVQETSVRQCRRAATWA